VGRVAPLAVAQRRALARLKKADVFDDVYLAGGTAVALHLGHRRSVDLDLFSLRADLDLEAIADRLHAAGATTIGLSDATLSVRIGTVPIDFVRYPYKTIGAFERGPENVRVASLRDLAVMKLAAIARRGIRRDFWDLHAIIDGGATTLTRVIDDYRSKFGLARSDVYHVLRALTWFEDAERDDVMPGGMTVKKWRDVRAWFEGATARELIQRTRNARSVTNKVAKRPKKRRH
jgi:hypothetical protein